VNLEAQFQTYIDLYSEAGLSNQSSVRAHIEDAHFHLSSVYQVDFGRWHTVEYTLPIRSVSTVVGETLEHFG
jgi:hypothetical protein